MAEAASTANVKGLLCEVEAQLFLLAPSTGKKGPTITMVTVENVSSCYAVWGESSMFEFGSAFQDYFSGHMPSASAGTHCCTHMLAACHSHSVCLCHVVACQSSIKHYTLLLGGPSHPLSLTAGPSTVLALVSELSAVADWFHLGFYLGVPLHELWKVEADHGGCHSGRTERCKIEMLDWWLKNDKQTTWPDIVWALKGIGMNGLAQKIAVKYSEL